MKVTKYFNPRLNQYGYYMTDANGDIKTLTYEDGLKQGIVMLEQIREEIKSAYCKCENDYDHGRNYGLYIAEQFIDKAIKEAADGQDR